MPLPQTYDGLSLTPQALLDYAQSQERTSVCSPLTTESKARSLAAPVLVRSAAGTHTRLHKLDNHFAWLAISLHLDALQRNPRA